MYRQSRDSNYYYYYSFLLHVLLHVEDMDMWGIYYTYTICVMIQLP